jgi:hypothetical protein
VVVVTAVMQKVHQRARKECECREDRRDVLPVQDEEIAGGEEDAGGAQAR